MCSNPHANPHTQAHHDHHPSRLALPRRDLLKYGLGSAALVAGLSLPARLARADDPTLSATEGPFWTDDRLLRSDIRTDPANNNALQPGLPLRLSVSVSRLISGVPTPLPNAWVDLWHANGAGTYSNVTGGAGNPNTFGQKWLRGYQITDAHGMTRFTTIYPGWYIGRAVHIHCRIRRWDGTNLLTNFTTQFFFAETTNSAVFTRLASTYNHSGSRTLNSTDGIYASTGGAVALLRLADDGTHAIASFNVKLNITGARAAGWDEFNTPLACEDDHAFDFGGGTPSLALRDRHEC